MARPLREELFFCGFRNATCQSKCMHRNLFVYFWCLDIVKATSNKSIWWEGDITWDPKRHKHRICGDCYWGSYYSVFHKKLPFSIIFRQQLFFLDNDQCMQPNIYHDKIFIDTAMLFSSYIFNRYHSGY